MTTTTRPGSRHRLDPAPLRTEPGEGRSTDTDGAADEIPVGTTVEVRSRFDRRWARGFSVDSVDEATYRLRRTSDGAVLPARFAPEDVRPARSA